MGFSRIPGLTELPLLPTRICSFTSHLKSPPQASVPKLCFSSQTPCFLQRPKDTASSEVIKWSSL